MVDFEKGGAPKRKDVKKQDTKPKEEERSAEGQESIPADRRENQGARRLPGQKALLRFRCMAFHAPG